MATLVLTASGLVLTAGTAAAGTSYFPLERVGGEIERIGGRPPRQPADHLRGRQRV